MSRSDGKGIDEQRAQVAQREALAREQYVDDFKWLMDDPRGRRLVHKWLQRAGIYEKSYTGNSETFYLEGRRSFGLELLADVNTIRPKSFVTMLEEQQND